MQSTLRGFQLELPFHAHLGHDQVARVALNLVVAQGNGFGFDFECGGHENLLKLKNCRIYELTD